jgi:hypothetical protein
MSVGKIYIKGSCHPNCVKTGECCSDYQICEFIEKSHSIDCLEPNCKLCTRDRKVCLQCKDNFFNDNSKCMVNCPKNTVQVLYVFYFRRKYEQQLRVSYFVHLFIEC